MSSGFVNIPPNPVIGPNTSTSNAIPRYANSIGTRLSDSPVTIDDSGDMGGVASVYSNTGNSEIDINGDSTIRVIGDTTFLNSITTQSTLAVGGADPQDASVTPIVNGNALSFLQSSKFLTGAAGTIMNMTPAMLANGPTFAKIIFTVLGSTFDNSGGGTYFTKNAAYTIEALLLYTAAPIPTLTIINQSTTQSYGSDVAFSATLATDGTTSWTIMVTQPNDTKQYQWRCVAQTVTQVGLP